MRRTDPEWIQFPVEYYREMKVYRCNTVHVYSLDYPLYIYSHLLRLAQHAMFTDKREQRPRVIAYTDDGCWRYIT